MKNFIIVLVIIFSCGKENLINIVKMDKERASKGNITKDREEISKCIWILSKHYIEVKKGKKREDEILREKKEATNKLEKMDRLLLEREALTKDRESMYIPLFEAINRKSEKAIYLLYKRYVELEYDFEKEWNIGREEKYTFAKYLKKGFKKGLNFHDTLEDVIKRDDDIFLQILLDAGLDIKRNEYNMLMGSITYESEKCLNKLISIGVNLNIQNKEYDELTPLMVATKDGQEKFVKQLIEAKVNLNLVEKHGWNAVIIATKYGQEKCLKRLIEAGAYLNMKNKDGFNSALTLGSQFQNYECIKQLIEAEVDFNITKECELNILLILLSNNDQKCLNKFMKAMEQSEYKEVVEDVNEKNLKGYSPITYACNRGDIPLVKQLIEAGVDVNEKDFKGYSPITYACNKGNIPLVEQLLRNGADVNTSNKDGVTLLMGAVKKGFIELVELLLERGAKVNATTSEGKYTALIYLCIADTTKIDLETILNIAKKLIEAGAIVNAKDRNGNTPILTAIKKNNFPLTKYLCSVGANIHIANNSCETAYDYLKKLNNIDFEDLILQVERANEALKLLLTLSSRKETQLLVGAKKAIKEGADVNISSEKGVTLLIRLACSKNSKAIRYLENILSHTNLVNVDQKDGDGNTALSLAAGIENIDSIRLLLKAGADVNSINRIGQTPLMMACALGNIELVKLLLKNGADASMKDSSNRSTSFYADNNRQIIGLLIKSLQKINKSEDRACK